jgi:hypothetical protein
VSSGFGHAGQDRCLIYALHGYAQERRGLDTVQIYDLLKETKKVFGGRTNGGAGRMGDSLICAIFLYLQGE